MKFKVGDIVRDPRYKDEGKVLEKDVDAADGFPYLVLFATRGAWWYAEENLRRVKRTAQWDQEDI